MGANENSFYVTGGTLRSDAPSYVERQADQDLYDGLRRGEFCYVLTSRQMGKSSLMVRTAVRLKEDGVQVAVLDLTAIGQNLSPEQWYGGLLRRLGRQLDLEDELEEFWDAQVGMGPLDRWMEALQEAVLPALGAPEDSKVENLPVSQHSNLQPSNLQPGAARLIIFIDEIDAVRSLPFSADEFFAAIRECYTRRAQDAQFERIIFCLLGVATPSDLIRDTRMTPFNIGTRIDLSDFSAAEAAPLVRGLGQDKAAGRRLLERILYWSGGHPYLTQRLCRAVAEEASGPPPNTRHPTPKGVDRLCTELFLSAAARERDDNLIFVRERLLKSEADTASLLDLYGKVRSGVPVHPDDTNPLLDLLRLSGIARLTANRLVVRNRIYGRVFDVEWVRQHMPDAELRRQRAAYRRGLVRATAVAAVIVALMLGLVANAARKAHEAQEARVRAAQEASRANRNLYAANMNLLQSDWESGNGRRMLQLLSDTRDYRGRGFEWGYWNRLCHLELRTLKGHTDPVTSVSYSPDGKRIATGSVDKTVRIWDARTGSELLKIRNPSSYLGPVRFSPDGQRLVAVSIDGLVTEWNTKSGRVIHTLQEPRDGIHNAEYSPDSRRIVTSGDDGTVRLWDTATGKATRVLLKQEGRVYSASYSPNGRRILVIGSSQRAPIVARLVDAENGREILTLKASPHLVVHASFSPDGRRILTGHLDGTSSVWDAETGREIFPLKGRHRGPVNSTAFSRDGRKIVTGSADTTAKVWDAESGQERLTVKGNDGDVCTSISPNGQRLVTGSLDGTVKVWDIQISHERRTIAGGHGAVFSANYSPDGSRIVTRGKYGTARVWDAASGKETLGPLRGHTASMLVASFSPDGRRILTAGGSGKPPAGNRDNIASVWDAASGQEILQLKGHSGAVSAAGFSPDGQRIVTGGDGGIVTFWDARSGKRIGKLPGMASLVQSVCFSPDGRRILVGGLNLTRNHWLRPGGATLPVLDAETGRPTLTLNCGNDYALAVAFSPDGGRIVAGLGPIDGVAKVWNAHTGQELVTLTGHTGYVTAIAFSADGKRILTGSSDKTAKLWDAETGRELLTLEGHTNTIRSVSFSPDGRSILTASMDGTAIVWLSRDPK